MSDTDLGGVPLRDFARSHGVPYFTLWTLVQRHPTLAVKVQGARGNLGWRYLLTDPVRAAELIAALPPPRPRRPSTRQPPPEPRNMRAGEASHGPL